MTREEKMEAALKRILHNCANQYDCEWTGIPLHAALDRLSTLCVQALKKEEGDIIWGDPNFKIEGESSGSHP